MWRGRECGLRERNESSHGEKREEVTVRCESRENVELHREHVHPESREKRWRLANLRCKAVGRHSDFATRPKFVCHHARARKMLQRSCGRLLGDGIAFTPAAHLQAVLQELLGQAQPALRPHHQRVHLLDLEELRVLRQLRDVL